MLGINTNVTSLTAQRNLSGTTNSMQTTLQRLSSGLRINSAKDDAAGLAISERMTSQIRGLDQARRNANDGISLAQTAEGALSGIGENLQRMRELAVQAANDTNTASDRQTIQKEIDQLKSEIDRVAQTTEFNGQKLLDGSFTAKNFQVGANANQSISVGMSNAQTGAIGNNTLDLTGANVTINSARAAGADVATIRGAAGAGVMAAQNLTVTGADGTATVAITQGQSVKSVVQDINNSGTGVKAEAVSQASFKLADAATGNNIAFQLSNGTDPAVNINVSNVNAKDLTSVRDAINNASGATGITASLADGDKGELILKGANGESIEIGDFATTNPAGGAVATGLATVQGMNGYNNSLTGTAVNLGAAVGTDSTVIGATLQFSSDKGGFSMSSNLAGDGTDFGLFNGAAGTNHSAVLSAVAAMDLTTSAKANSSIKVLDAALTMINNQRADLGAVQNRFTSVISNLQSTSENLSASRSRIKDADFAQETANLSRNQVLQQAGTAMLAQANQGPQIALQLLR